ncbi:hypothetical protein DM01DRAFT_1290651 [Hesseltinella vesiculosa]|uniref:Phosphoesterase-domain-containing protein n=1 Tax=Hesseltinella vesiculosa TaxID=101127 RepID=A0A1X2GBR5_9FUNG|nr:hypothetical protein DM01DRAFT_1290651 [Hesseltinella vesiculosa]
MKWLSLASACFLISHLVQCVPVDSDKPAPSVQGKHFDRMVVIVLSDANYADAIKDPYLSTLADRHQGLTLTNYKGLALPSQANYVGMISGSTSGVVLDSDANINDRKTVVDLLESKGISWKTYQEDYTPLADGSCNSAKNIGNYVRYHNPFMAFQSISKSPSRCQYIVPGTQLDVDIKNNAVPQFVFYTPNVNEKGGEKTLISNVSSASSWLKEFLEPKMTQDAFSKDTLVVVTWDKQSSVTTNNHVLTMLLGSMVNRSSKSDGVPYNHYSILKTVQDNWGLPSLGQKDVGATPFILKDLAGKPKNRKSFFG